MIDLILKDIQDPFIRENFFRLTRFLNGQLLFEGDFQIYDVEIEEASLSHKVKHGLRFIPTDVIMLAVEGDFNFYFNYQDFDRTFMYITASGPCRLRFLAGKFSDKVGKQVKEKFPLIAPGDSYISVPGPAGSVVRQFTSDASTLPGDPVIVSGVNTVSKISSNLSSIIPNGIFGFCSNKPDPITAEVMFSGLLTGFGGFSVGSALFIDTDGTLTHVPPSTGMVQQVGTATTNSEFFIQLMQPMRRA